jgi:hypothetical protein
MTFSMILSYLNLWPTISFQYFRKKARLLAKIASS